MCYIDYMDRLAKLRNIVQGMYAGAKELGGLYPGLHFTLDGHLVGSIGEAIAQEEFGIKLFPASTKTHDGSFPDGRLVQIKTTQAKSIGLRSEPDNLIVITLLDNGGYEIVYNGAGAPVWDRVGLRRGNGQRFISLKEIRRIKAGKPAYLWASQRLHKKSD